MGLAIPILASEVPGNYVTSALWNANVYNGLTYAQQPPDFVGYQSTAQSIPTSSWTTLNFDTSPTDTYGGHSAVTNPSRYTCQVGVPGWYTCCGVYAPTGNATGFRAVKMQVNGVAVLGGAAYINAGAAVELGVVTPTKDVFLNVGDYVEICGYQNTGSALNTILDGDLRTGLWVRWSHA
ncbi:hypothetical protein [Kitasatospora sp. NBC_01302]|uniref:hypothetical protein n=1 Tax=Kitasatospora sp. NBC_01302 TaxID=2903575 RepID=UPI002E1633BA|nr:hypothetical protein OG294_14445 [Kitasatospora sp. NBC_01302]